MRRPGDQSPTIRGCHTDAWHRKGHSLDRWNHCIVSSGSCYHGYLDNLPGSMALGIIDLGPMIEGVYIQAIPSV